MQMEYSLDQVKKVIIKKVNPKYLINTSLKYIRQNGTNHLKLLFFMYFLRDDEHWDVINYVFTKINNY